MIIKKIFQEGHEGVVFILGSEDTKKLKLLLSDGVQAHIEFDVVKVKEKVEEDKLFTDPLKGFQDNTKKSIIELIKRFKNSPFTTNDFGDIRRKYYVPSLSGSIKKLEKNELATIKSLSHRLKVYQFSEKLCNHFGN
jgi:hypothetical protein